MISHLNSLFIEMPVQSTRDHVTDRIISITENAQWLHFLQDFASKNEYKKRFDEFATFHCAKKKDVDIAASIEEYIDYHHFINYKRSTLSTWISVIKKYTEVSGTYDTAEQKSRMNSIFSRCYADLNKWSKKETIKKAWSFESQNLIDYLNLPSDEYNLPRIQSI